MKEVIFKVVDLVDEKLGREIKAAGRGLILHDGWTCAGVRYIDLFASYPVEREKEEKKTVKGQRPQTDGVQLSLVSGESLMKRKTNWMSFVRWL